jgi:hypothetical protein
LRGTRADEHAYTCNMHCSEGKSTPQSGLQECLLPLRAHDDVVRWLFLVSPDGFDGIGACVLAVCCVEEQLQHKEARTCRYKGVQEQEV